MIHDSTKTAGAITAGIDTGKKRLSLGFWPRGDRYAFDNGPQSFAKIAAILKAAGVKRAGIESTSVYHLAVTDYLRAEGFEVAVLQPSKVKAFARLQGIRAKSDASDAELVAGAAQAQERVYAPQAPEIALFAEHLTYIEQCEDNCARMKTQAERFKNPDLIARKRTEIALAKRAIRKELKELEKTARLYPDISLNLDLAVTVPGLGMRTALTLVIRMPELGTLGRERAASLLGVAPFDDDTADHIGVRRIQGGRAKARKAVFMAAFSGAMHHNEWLKKIYKRRIAAGATHTRAVIACARKLIGLLDAIFARKTPWETRGGIQCPD
jgi:transposase